MTKLCPRGKAAAKRKFKVYPSAYANAYASKICAGKIKDPSGVKRKDFRGSKAEGGRIGYSNGGRIGYSNGTKNKNKKKKIFKRDGVEFDKPLGPRGTFNTGNPPKRYEVAGGGLMEATARLKRQGLKKGGGVDTGKKGERRSKLLTMLSRYTTKTRSPKRAEKMGGGMMRPMYRKGGGVCLRGMNRDAIGKNS